MKIITDLHVHSKYSRATARDLDLENLYEAAQIKGIQLVGTGTSAILPGSPRSKASLIRPNPDFCD